MLTSNALRIHIQSCGNYTVNINVLATMDVKNCKGTQPLSPSKRSFNFLTLFLDFTLTSNTLFTYSPDHHSRMIDLLVNVHDTEYLSPFSQITILETFCKRSSADLCRSLTRVSTVFLISAEGNWFWKLYGLVILPHSQNVQLRTGPDYGRVTRGGFFCIHNSVFHPPT